MISFSKGLSKNFQASFFKQKYVLQKSLQYKSSFIQKTRLCMTYVFQIQGGRKVLHKKIFTGRAGKSTHSGVTIHFRTWVPTQPHIAPDTQPNP